MKCHSSNQRWIVTINATPQRLKNCHLIKKMTKFGGMASIFTTLLLSLPRARESPKSGPRILILNRPVYCLGYLFLARHLLLARANDFHNADAKPDDEDDDYEADADYYNNFTTPMSTPTTLPTPMTMPMRM